MQTTRLGRTELTVTKTAFGCLPLQRISVADAVSLLKHAVRAGITFFDTARVYTDSEEKLGIAFEGVRQKLVIATKTTAKDAQGVKTQLQESLSKLKTDYIDIYQFHNPPFVPKPGGADGLYDAMLAAKASGKIRHIGITQHTIDLAEEALESGLYDTIQYPFNHLASAREVALVKRCQTLDVGFICMKALSGGLITDASIPFIYLSTFANAVPIWGFQRPEELSQLLYLSENPPEMTREIKDQIEADRQALSGSFCRGCGYCLPCPVGIPIHNANRMTQLLQRSPVAGWLSPAWREDMARIAKCTHCGACAKRCPYGLKPFDTLPDHLAYYQKLLREKGLS